MRERVLRWSGYGLLGTWLTVVPGCASGLPHVYVSLSPRPDVTVVLPCLEPRASSPQAAPLRPVGWDGEERLNPPKGGAGDDKGKGEQERKKDDEGKNDGKDERGRDRDKQAPDISGADGSPGNALTLLEAIQLCLKADPKLKAAAEVIGQARADLVAASTGPNPTLDVVQGQNAVFRALKPNDNLNPPQVEIDIGYPIDWCLFGKMAANVASARAGVEVSEYDYAEALRQRVGEVVVAYYDILEARALLALARQDLDTLRRVESSLEKAVELGGKPRVDLNRVRIDRLRSEQALREAVSALEAGRSRLGALLGQTDADTSFDAAGDLPGGDLPGGEVSVALALAAAQRSRPDVLSARAQVAKAQADIEAEDRKGYPSLTSRAQYLHSFERRTISSPAQDYMGLGLSMTLPCQDRNQGGRIKARSKAAQEQHELQNKLVDLRAEVERLVREYRVARANAQVVGGEQLRLAREVRDAVSRSYELGGRPLLDLLDAQRSYRETNRLRLSALASFYRAAARLHNATGVVVQK